MKKITAAISRLHPTNRSLLKLNKRNNMIRYFLCGLILSICSIGCGYSQVKAPAPYGPVPSENQLRWQEMEYYAFIHFSLNTYTDQSWGYGNEDVNLFNPKDLDCRQWARICKEAGMTGVILVQAVSQFNLCTFCFTSIAFANAHFCFQQL
ncbi:MAG: alpha-L-fucosidase, partial [Sedimentisphaerales bacterium]|nr:alpha-L-fucosidase [Sedimentisphaerales bacterium]